MIIVIDYIIYVIKKLIVNLAKVIGMAQFELKHFVKISIAFS